MLNLSWQLGKWSVIINEVAAIFVSLFFKSMRKSLMSCWHSLVLMLCMRLMAIYMPKHWTITKSTSLLWVASFLTISSIDGCDFFDFKCVQVYGWLTCLLLLSSSSVTSIVGRLVLCNAYFDSIAVYQINFKG